jgi:hypothetical protein
MIYWRQVICNEQCDEGGVMMFNVITESMPSSTCQLHFVVHPLTCHVAELNRAGWLKAELCLQQAVFIMVQADSSKVISTSADALAASS